MALPVNRFNMPNASSFGNQTAYFKPVVVGATKDVIVDLNRGADISASLNSIIQTVHSHLKTRPYIRAFTTKAIPQVIQQPEPAVNAKGKAVSNRRQIPPALPSQQQSPLSKKNFLMRSSSSAGAAGDVAHIKACWSERNQLRQRRYIGGPEETNNFATQKRIRDVLRQKRILEDMLMSHKKLQRDRVSIQNELFSMRNYLNDIRNRLDNSLNTLHTKRTIFASYRKPTARPSVSSNSSIRTSSTNSTTQRRNNNTVRFGNLNNAGNQKSQRMVPIGRRLQRYVAGKKK